jgi:hypothetical protein
MELVNIIHYLEGWPEGGCCLRLRGLCASLSGSMNLSDLFSHRNLGRCSELLVPRLPVARSSGSRWLLSLWTDWASDTLKMASLCSLSIFGEWTISLACDL